MENLIHLPNYHPSGMSKRCRRWPGGNTAMGCFSCIPWFIGFLGFTLLPMIATLFFTFIDLKITTGILTSPKWVGLANYVTLFKDNQVWNARPNSTPGSLWVTFRFGIIALPVGIFLTDGDRTPDEQQVAERAKFFPLDVLHALYHSLCRQHLPVGRHAQPEGGWINRALMAMGVPRIQLPGWANDINWVYPAYVIMGIWGIGNAMLTMLAGIQAVPTDLYDAAKVDGAGSWRYFLECDLPDDLAGHLL